MYYAIWNKTKQDWVKMKFRRTSIEVPRLFDTLRGAEKAFSYHKQIDKNQDELIVTPVSLVMESHK